MQHQAYLRLGAVWSDARLIFLFAAVIVWSHFGVPVWELLTIALMHETSGALVPRIMRHPRIQCIMWAGKRQIRFLTASYRSTTLLTGTLKSKIA